MLAILKVMQSHPDKIFPVYARSRRYVYLDYEEDYCAQRYGLASYLLGMTPLSTFKYHSHFQTTFALPGRTDGLAYYADYDLDLGQPTGKMFVDDGVYERRFSKALVAVAPMYRGHRRLKLDRPYFTPEGQRREGMLELEQGTGAIMLADRPAPAPNKVVVDDFENGRPGEWRFPVRDAATKVAAEGDGQFLQIRLASDAIQPYHERRVQPIRSLICYPRLAFRIRTQDKSAAVLIRVEVDDASPAKPPAPAKAAPSQRSDRWPYAVLVVRPRDGSFIFKPIDADIPYGQLKHAPRAPYFAVSESLIVADGQWHDVKVDLTAAFAQLAPQLTPRRVAEMRVLGEVDLDDLILSR